MWFYFHIDKKFDGFVMPLYLLAKRFICYTCCCCNHVFIVRVCLDVFGCIWMFMFSDFHYGLEPLVIYCWTSLGGVGFLVTTGVMRDRLT